MESKLKLAVFRFLAGFVAVYHLVLGLLANFATTEILKKITTLYGISPEINDQFLYLVKFAAAYGLGLAFLMFFVAVYPKKYGFLAWAAIIMFCVRILDRIIYSDILRDSFNATTGENIRMMSVAFIFGLCLFLFMPKKEKDEA